MSGRYAYVAVGSTLRIVDVSSPATPWIVGSVGRAASAVDVSGSYACIATGSSGVQSIPLIAKQAKALYVFQRTANFVLPARNRALRPDEVLNHKATYRERRRAAYDTPFGIAGYPAPEKSALEATPQERETAYAEKWAQGGSISFLYAYTDLLLDKRANDTAAEFVRARIRETVKDPCTAELLCPYDHPIGTKRLILDTGYYETFNLDHVKLVDVRSAPIQRLTAHGLRTDNAHYELDAVVFATGFDAMTGAMKDIDIQVDTGADIASKWENGPRTYLGIMMAQFPNLFMVTGPQSPGVKSQMILSIEQHVDFITRCLRHMERHGHDRIEALPEAEAEWVAHNNEVANATLYPLANSWYMGANIPGKPRIFMPYVGGVHNYYKHCQKVIANDFEGFTMSRAASATAPMRAARG